MEGRARRKKLRLRRENQMIENILEYLLGAIVKIQNLFSLSFKKSEKRDYHNSIHQESKNFFSKVSQQVNIQKFDEVPEFHLHLYGSGAKRKIEGHAEKKDSRTLVLESIEIGSAETKVDKQFTRLLPLTDINFSDSLFTTKQPEINVTVHYRTLDGKKYQLLRTMTQEIRADGLFNVLLSGSPHIRNVKSQSDISELEKRVLEKLYKTYKETGQKIKWRAKDMFEELNIKDRQDLSALHDSKYMTIALEGTHECFVITTEGIRYMDNQ